MKVSVDKPKCADWVETGDLTIYVYPSGQAMLELPYFPEDETRDIFMSEEDLRDLAEAAIWAADRLAAKTNRP